MARELSKTEALAFIDAPPARTGKLAVVRANGRPHVAPVWVALDGDELLFMTGADTAKGKAVRRDPFVALSFDDERPPFAFVLVEGDVMITTDLDEMLQWSTVIAGRYMGDKRAEEFGRRNAVEGELLVRVRPTKIVGSAGVAD